ncbi:TPA: lipopolysaccharide biosynthesis protein [Vibrio vulnificus]|nr:polysaccharide biosynthesis C-terminal domain-containing protein [Vibrio vulnificus]
MLSKLKAALKGNSFGASDVISRLIIWCALPLCAIFIEAKDYGELVLLYTYISILSPILLFGQGRAVLKYAGEKSNFSTSTPVLICSAVTTLIFVPVYYYDPIKVNILLAAYLLSIIMILSNRSRVYSNIKTFVFLRLGYGIARLMLLLILSLFFTIFYYVYVEIISIFVVLIPTAIYLLLCKEKKIKFDVTDIKKSALFGFPLFLQSVFLVISQHFDKIFIAHYLSKEHLGNYAFMFTFCSCVSFIFSFFAQKYEVKVYQADTLNQAKSYSKDFFCMCVKASGVFYFISVACYYISTVLASGNYEFMPLDMTLLFFSQCINMLILKYSYVLTFLEKNSKIFMATVIGAIFSVTSIYFLVPILGLLGAVFSSLCANLVTMLFLRLQLSREYKLSNQVA